MVKGSKLQSGLESSESPLHFHELFIAQGHLLRTEAVIAGGEGMLSIQVLFRFHPGSVNLERSVLLLPEVAAHGPMGQEGTDRFLVGLSPLVPQGRKSLFQFLKSPFSGGLVFLSLVSGL